MKIFVYEGLSAIRPSLTPALMPNVYTHLFVPARNCARGVGLRIGKTEAKREYWSDYAEGRFPSTPFRQSRRKFKAGIVCRGWK